MLVHEDNVTRSQWKMAKGLEQITGRDREVRGAKLKLISKGKAVYMNRGVQKLFPLEVCSVDGEPQGGTQVYK